MNTFDVSLRPCQARSPLVTVVVPAYNAGPYLHDTFENLRRQSFRDFEVIFVDDCSGDNTQQLLEQFAAEDPRFRYIRHEKNQGCGAARNTGLHEALGTYAICLDADDAYHPELLERMVLALEVNGADIAVCCSTVVNVETGQRRTFGQWRRLEPLICGETLVLDPPADQPGICDLIDYVAWSKMFRLSFFRERELWFPNLKYYEDIPFAFLSCLLAQKLVFVKKPLIEYRIKNAGSMTSWTIPKQFYMIDAFHHIIRRKTELDWEKIGSALIVRAMNNIGAMYFSEGTSREDRQIILRRMRSVGYDLWELDRYLNSGIFSKMGEDFLTEITSAPALADRLLFHWDTVGICGMSDPLPTDRRHEVEALLECCRELGLNTALTPLHRPNCDNPAYRDAETRAEWLMDLYRQKNLDFIFDFTGGNLANEILAYLDYDLIRNNRKVFAGYSDLTCVLNAIYAKTGQPGLLYRINNLYKDHSGQQMERFRRSLMQGSTDLYDFAYQFIQGQQMEGIVVGGNIRCLLKLAGTEYWPDMTGKILFLESLDDRITSTRANIGQLRALGVFDQLAGVVIGTFGMEEQPGLTIHDHWILSQVPGKLPVAKTKEIGHGYLSKAIWIGKPVHMVLEHGSTGRIKEALHETACAE